MHRAWARILFTIGSFVPPLGVFGLAGWLIVSVGRIDTTRPDRNLEEALVFLGGATLIAFWQMFLGIFVAVHTAGRKDMSSGAKIAWTLGCLFVGSIALPIFSFVVLPGAERAHAQARAAAAAGPAQPFSPYGQR
jgi:cytochrome bd-type quinol oxidase subunit 2